MSLYIQDPNDPTGTYLLEALLEGCDGALAGGGAFAFVSTEGVKLFLEDEGFKSFAAKNSFELVFGVDAITNTKALEAIERAASETEGLVPRVFLPSKPGTIFHPKFCWFRKPKGGVLITGSGNLTRGGLRWNVEAFTWANLSSPDIKSIQERWQEFQTRSAGRLRPTTDVDVIKHAKANDVVQKVLGDVRKEVEPGDLKDKDPEKAETQPSPADEVLIVEIPAAGDRWKQANFHKATFEEYFGAKPGAQQRIFLFSVNDDGTLAPREVRPSVEVKSRNFRFELEAASGLPYPKSGRPVAVFIRMATRTFRYRLLMPTSADFKVVEKYLTKAAGNAGPRMRETRLRVNELKKIWPAAPFWKAP
ncbi:MAG: phospholipase D family protein [Betaproteobacteria bacterium]